MKKIADIPYGIDGDGEPVDKAYAGGIIVKLSNDEAIAIKMLQEAMDGAGWYNWEKPNDIRFCRLKEKEFSPIFELIQLFTEAKMYVNDMQDAVDTMTSYLMALENQEDEDD